MNKIKRAALIILDGWGIGNGSKSDAIANANVPFYKGLLKKYPHSQLLASGENVGLPDGQMGNSEVGHLNIGAGRVVYQDLVKINKAVDDKSFFKNEALLKSMEYALKNNKALHLLGLVSDGGVHSNNQHLYALCDMATSRGVREIYIHAFTDGRDTDPKSGYQFIKELEEHLKASKSNAKIASVIGRYYAMDRDKRWERVRLAYDLMVNSKGTVYQSALDAIQDSYNNDITDEFIKACLIIPNGNIKDGDAVICFNYRTDRCREITEVLCQNDMPEQDMKKLNLHYTTMTKYDEKFTNVHVAYEKDNLENTLGEVLANNGKTQLRMAETEKYPHVTFFFSGGREAVFNGEKRIVIPSPKVATYDLQPEMSAALVRDAAVIEMSKNDAPDFVCINFANPDMVGHTGVYKAVTKALETVDSCLEKVVENGLQNNYSFIIIADHGNADFMINDDGSPNTAHSLNPVPCILIDTDFHQIKNGRLADIAPSILKILNIPQSPVMTGEILIS